MRSTTAARTTTPGSSLVRRTAVAASALSLALLVGACGGSDDSSADSDKNSGKSGDKTKASAAAKPAADAAGATALPQAELEKLALAEGDVKNYKIAKASAADVAAGAGITTDNNACTPLIDVLGLRPTGKPGASTPLRISSVPQKPAADAPPEDALAALTSMTITAETLSSYEGQGAPEALEALRAAGKACAGGFTYTVGGEKTKVTKVAPATYTAGDEAVAYTVTTDVEGEPTTSPLVAVRKDGLVAAFVAINLGGESKQPKDLIDAQLAKLG
ncbi:hypothetical protein [Streptomyces liangshanensis]|uniref:Lipoprotein n=1 Tax=Streptomyces liangshanensis TaxID=2717324 RepID=A0A6G9GZR0_9ACTN|nr:hypothetical protein [Streptomyces liangshanensis]QIQ03529.1 hypothetical protein HA039_15380 [Streptomyces liangshanensis]